ncbi:AI-2E family transporter [soil metagenome]
MNVYLTLATRYGLNILGLLGASAALYLGSSIFIPLVISGLLAAILYPAAEWVFKRFKLPWFLSCMSVISLLIMLAAVITLTLAASVPQMINRLPDSEEKWERKYEIMAQRLADASPFPLDSALPAKAANSNFYKTVKNLFSPDRIGGYVQKLAGEAAFYLSHTALVLFITLFLMLEGELLAKKVRAIFGGNHDSERRVTEAIAQMAEAIRTYLVWRTIINILLGLLVALVYKLIGLEQWYLWGLLTMVLNYVPYIGTIAAGIPPVAEALIGGNTSGALVIILGYTLLVTFEGYWIVPRVMGKTMDLNATTVMVTCLYWNLVWGIAGLFLAMPLMAAVKSILMHVEGWQPWGELLSSVDTTPVEHPKPVEPAADEKTIRIGEPLGVASPGSHEAEIRH